MMKSEERKNLDTLSDNHQPYHNLRHEPDPPGVVIPVNMILSSDLFDPQHKIPDGMGQFQRMVVGTVRTQGLSEPDYYVLLLLYLENLDDSGYSRQSKENT